MTEKQNSTVTIKGIKNGILVTLDAHEEWLRVTGELADHIDARSSFFTGVNITIDLGSRPVAKGDLGTLTALLNRRGLTVWSVMSDSETTIESAHALDLKTNVANTVPRKPEDNDLPQLNHEEKGTPGVLVKRTLRSGRLVRSEGHVVIFGDVNPGAEIIAGGDVIVWGRLRGTVHAGAEGDESAIVCALDMSPTQLRIARQIVTSPPDKRNRNPQPEIAQIKDGQIIVDTWR